MVFPVRYGWRSNASAGLSIVTIALAAAAFFAVAMTVSSAGAAAPVSVSAAAQERTQIQRYERHRVRYILQDLGTFGGPVSGFINGFDGFLNDAGRASGWADTPQQDPYPSYCFNPNCYVSHAFRYQNGIVTDLGVLPNGASSQAFWTSPNGLITGNSQNGQIDPLVSGFPEIRAVLWRGRHIINLGTIEGGYESLASAVNSRGQVAGLFLNTVSDQYSFFAPLFTTEVRAFLWHSGTMQDLGTLGGPDAIAAFVNEGGHVSGQSYINSTPNPGTGIPTIDPFLWSRGPGSGTMLDLGTLGGTLGFANAMNDFDDVVGQSDLAGDQTFHPFLWTPQKGMQDLGTLGGPTGTTNWINDAGDIAGKADLGGGPPQKHDAVLWRHGTEMIDLGTLPGDSCSNAYYVNARGQVVGTSENQKLCDIPVGEHAFLWEHGGPMVDLNTVVAGNAPLRLVFAFAINDQGEIAGIGVPPGVPPKDVGLKGHAYVLIPCTERPYFNHCGEEIVTRNDVSATKPFLMNHYPRQSGVSQASGSGLATMRAMLSRRFPMLHLTLR